MDYAQADIDKTFVNIFPMPYSLLVIILSFLSELSLSILTNFLIQYSSHDIFSRFDAKIIFLLSVDKFK